MSVTERELGGIPNTSEDIRQAHAAAIETYIEDHVGITNFDTGDHGKMYFNRTLEDWARFDITKRQLQTHPTCLLYTSPSPRDS